MLDDRTIRYVAAVVRLGSIRGAARELGLAPSAVQRTIAAAERRVGLELFERGAGGALATEAGRIVAAQAQDRRDLDAQLAQHLGELKGLTRGQVSVATGDGFVAALWQRVAEPFLHDHPDVQLEVITGGTDDIIDLLVADRADVAVALHPRVDRAVRQVRAREEPLRVICRPDHHFATRGRVDPAELDGTDFAVMPERFGLRTLHEQLLRTYNVTANPRLQSESLDVIINAVLSDVALALLPSVTVGQYLEAGLLVATPLDDPQVSQVQAKLLARRSRRLLPAPAAFVTMCAEQMFPDG